MSRIVLIATLIAAVGCGKKDEPAASSGGAVAKAKAKAKSGAKPSALWTLAPADAVAGIVVVDGALGKVANAIAEVDRMLRVRPGGEVVAGQLRGWLASLPVDPLDGAALKGMGVDLARGMAAFTSGQDQNVFILPVADRGAFRQAMSGTAAGDSDHIAGLYCGMVGDRYACATSEAGLKAVGATPGNGLVNKVTELSADLRGEVEVMVDIKRMPEELAEDIKPVVGKPELLAASVQFSAGGATLRGWLAGAKFAMLPAATSSPLANQAMSAEPAGLLRLAVPMNLLMNMAGPALEQELPGGTLAELLGDATGDVIAYAPGKGQPLMRIELGIKSKRRFAGLVDMACEKVSKGAPGVAVSGKDGRCKGTVNFARLAAAAGPELGLPGLVDSDVAIDVLVEDDRIRIELTGKADTEGASLATSPIGRDFTTQQWGIAAWGHALHYGLPADVSNTARSFAAMAPEQRQWMGLFYWLALHVYEMGFGFGVRDDGAHLLVHLDTFAGDPKDVYGEYERGIAQTLDGDVAGAEETLLQVAKRVPDSMVGRQMANRTVAGGMVVAGSVGILAAISIPAFVKYQRKSKASEAYMLVNMLGRGAEAYKAEHGAYPESAPLTPADPQSCCDKCAPDPQLWADPTWTGLMFAVDDPHYYAYQFENHGEWAIARAVGDLDCDGIFSTYELRIGEGGGTLSRYQELE